MKRILLSLTMVTAGFVGATETAKAQSMTLVVSGEILFLEKFNRFHMLDHYLGRMRDDMARASYDYQNTNNPNVRARAARFLDHCLALENEAVSLHAFLNSVQPTTVVIHGDADLREMDRLFQRLRNDPNARGQTYVFGGGTSASNVPHRPSGGGTFRVPHIPDWQFPSNPNAGDRPFGQP